MIVVLAEKPSVGRDLARILGARKNNNGWMEGNGYAVTWAFGHLIELEEPEKYDPALKKWTLESLPILPENFRLKISQAKGVKQQFKIIEKLFKSADSIICATDAGREGELIFRYIVEMSKCQNKPIKRLWINSLTDEAIKDGFANLQPISKYDNLAKAAKCRAQADWLVGLNATRAYTVKYGHESGLLSVGRVQTPILSLIVKKAQEIRNFKPEDYWELWTTYKNVKFKHSKNKFKTEKEAKSLIDKIKNDPFIITKIEEKKISQPPPLLFDLTGLQKAMNKSNNLTANDTLQIAQTLYERKFISYPRTDSCYLSDDIYKSCEKTLQNLTKLYPEEINNSLNLKKLPKSKRFFNSKKVTDHHAIIPTGQIPNNLSPKEKSVYEAIALRFLAIFYPNCEKASTTVHATAKEEKFKASGTKIISPGWQSLYKNNEDKEEQLLPNFEKNEQGPHLPEVKKCKTKPPKSYNEASLLSAMETAGKTIDDEELKEAIKERGLGTPATRAGIIETLLKRKYIHKEKKQLQPTSKGEELIRRLSLESNLTSAEMTADWEYKLKQIEKGETSSEEFIKNIKDFTKKIIGTVKIKKEIDPSNYGPCPFCQNKVIKGKTGYGCSNWKNGCAFRFHANQFGITLTDKDVQMLLFAGKTSYPRALNKDGNSIHGYITLNATSGTLDIEEIKTKTSKKALGHCPLCGSDITEKQYSYACIACEFNVRKKIAQKEISQDILKELLTISKTKKLDGFISKAGKPFSAALKIKEGKVSFDF